MEYPHCDPRALHEPGSCDVCDERPEWQELRAAWGINFTGRQDPQKLSCPSHQPGRRPRPPSRHEFHSACKDDPLCKTCGTHWAMHPLACERCGQWVDPRATHRQEECIVYLKGLVERLLGPRSPIVATEPKTLYERILEDDAVTSSDNDLEPSPPSRSATTVGTSTGSPAERR